MMQHRHNPRRKPFLRSTDGAITIEFVVMFPLIVAALAFSFEFGRMIVAHHMVVNNTRSAVRFLSRADLGDATKLTQATNIAETGNIAGTGFPPGLGVRPTATITPAQTTFTDADFRVDGQVLRIAVAANYQPMLFGFINFSNAGIPITIVEDMRHVGD